LEFPPFSLFYCRERKERRRSGKKGWEKEGAPPPRRAERIGGRPWAGAGAAKTGAAVPRRRVVRVLETGAEEAPPP
jgi:hypothetical protein